MHLQKLTDRCANAGGGDAVGGMSVGCCKSDHC